MCSTTRDSALFGSLPTLRRPKVRSSVNVRWHIPQRAPGQSSTQAGGWGGSAQLSRPEAAELVRLTLGPMHAATFLAWLQPPTAQSPRKRRPRGCLRARRSGAAARRALRRPEGQREALAIFNKGTLEHISTTGARKHALAGSFIWLESQRQLLVDAAASAPPRRQVTARETVGMRRR
jgi:hypothetical protein